MRFEIHHHHHHHFEGTLLMAQVTAEFQAQLDRATKALAAKDAEISDLTNKLAAATAADAPAVAAAAADQANVDTSALATSLAGAGVA